MGCDIHFFTEVKINGEWHLASSPNVQRSYRLFAKMANVRNYESIQPISNPRGWPADASVVANVHYQNYGDDAHSASWLSAKEASDLADWVRENWEPKPEYPIIFLGDIFGWVFGSNIDGFYKYPNDFPESIKDFRIVFFFDN